MTAKDLIKGQYYTFTRKDHHESNRFISKWQMAHMYPATKYFYNGEWKRFMSGEMEEAIDIKEATPREIAFMDTCIRHKGYVDPKYIEEPRKEWLIWN